MMQVSGYFNLHRIKALQRCGHEVKLIVPIPINPGFKYFWPFPKLAELIKFVQNRRKFVLIDDANSLDYVICKYISLPRKYFWQYESLLIKLFCGWKLNKIITSFRPDAVIASRISPEGTLIERKKIKNGSILVIAEGGELIEFPFKYLGWKKIEDKLNKNGSNIICVSKMMQRHIEDGNIYNLKKYSTVENGFDNEKYVYAHSIKGRKKVFVSVGRLEYVKGYDFIIDVLKDYQNDYVYYIIGEGTQRKNLESLLCKNNLLQKVVFLGEKKPDEILQILHQANLFIMPSRYESFGISALEALGTGLPVIGTKVGILYKIIVPGVTGYTFKFGDKQNALEVLNLAFQTSWNHKKISEFAHTNFSWDKWAREITQLLIESQ